MAFFQTFRVTDATQSLLSTAGAARQRPNKALICQRFVLLAERPIKDCCSSCVCSSALLFCATLEPVSCRLSATLSSAIASIAFRTNCPLFGRSSDHSIRSLGGGSVCAENCFAIRCRHFNLITSASAHPKLMSDGLRMAERHTRAFSLSMMGESDFPTVLIVAASG